MKSVIINFLTLLLACFAEEETRQSPEENVPKNLQGRELMAEMKEMCADLRDYGMSVALSDLDGFET